MEWIINTVYYVVASLLVFVGAGLSAGLLWDLADVLMGLMTLINIPVIILLGNTPSAPSPITASKRKRDLTPSSAPRISASEKILIIGNDLFLSRLY